MDAYVPVYSNSGNTWFPANDAATELIHLVHVWEDLAKINEIRLKARKGDEIADKLLLKFMLVEFFSALDHAKRLQGIIRQVPKLVAGRPAPSRYVTKKEFDRVTEEYKKLWRELAPLESLIADIRNNIGAHRSAEIGTETEKLWQELDAEKFLSLLNRIPALIEAVKDINIYNWSWMDAQSMTGGVFGCAIVHNWEDAFTEEEMNPNGRSNPA